MIHLSPTARDRAQIARDRIREIRRLRSGGTPTHGQCRQALAISERLGRGDRVTDAQVEFLEIVQTAACQVAGNYYDRLRQTEAERLTPEPVRMEG